MNIKISFKHLDHTPALDEKIRDKSQKFQKYFQGRFEVSWVCWVHHENHWAEIKLHGPKFTFFAKASSKNLYKSLDMVMDKMERQVEKIKTQKRNKIHYHQEMSPKNKQLENQIREEEKIQEIEYRDKIA